MPPARRVRAPIPRDDARQDGDEALAVLGAPSRGRGAARVGDERGEEREVREEAHEGRHGSDEGRALEDGEEPREGAGEAGREERGFEVRRGGHEGEVRREEGELCLGGGG